MQSSTGRRHLSTVKGHPDETDLGVISCLYFSSESHVLEFINTNGNAALTDGPIFRIDGLLREKDEKIPGPPVYAVPMGIGRLLVDFRGLRGAPNVVLSVAPEAGLNDGLLRLIVRTHNQCGVSARSGLACDFGEGWSTACKADVTPAGSPAKRLRGALDACFAKRLNDESLLGAGIDDSPAPPPPEPQPQPQPEPQPQPQPQLLAKVSRSARLTIGRSRSLGGS